MATHEFTAEQNPAVQTLATLLRRIAVLLFVRAGIQVVVTVIGWTQQGFGLSTLSALLIAGAIAAIGWLLWQPVDNLQRVVATTGRDIEEFMVAMTELSTALNWVRLVIGLFVVFIALDLVALLSR